MPGTASDEQCQICEVCEGSAGSEYVAFAVKDTPSPLEVACSRV